MLARPSMAGSTSRSRRWPGRGRQRALEVVVADRGHSSRRTHGEPARQVPGGSGTFARAGEDLPVAPRGQLLPAAVAARTCRVQGSRARTRLPAMLLGGSSTSPRLVFLQLTADRQRGSAKSMSHQRARPPRPGAAGNRHGADSRDRGVRRESRRGTGQSPGGHTATAGRTPASRQAASRGAVETTGCGRAGAGSSTSLAGLTRSALRADRRVQRRPQRGADPRQGRRGQRPPAAGRWRRSRWASRAGRRRSASPAGCCRCTGEGTCPGGAGSGGGSGRSDFRPASQAASDRPVVGSGYAAARRAARFAQPSKCRLCGSTGGVAAQPDCLRRPSGARGHPPQRGTSCRAPADADAGSAAQLPPGARIRQPHRLNVDPPDRDMTVLPPQQLRLHGRQTRLSRAKPGCGMERLQCPAGPTAWVWRVTGEDGSR